MKPNRKPKGIGGYYADIHPGDVVTFHSWMGTMTIKHQGILIERYKNGWIVELESGDNETIKSFSPDSDERLEYRLLGRPD